MAREGGYAKPSVRLPLQQNCPAGSTSSCRRNLPARLRASAERTGRAVAIDLDVHYYRVGLLNLPNAAQLHAIAEAGGEISAERIAAQISRRHARQKKNILPPRPPGSSAPIPASIRASANARCRCSCASFECRAWKFAVRSDRRISIRMNVATAISMNTAKKKQKNAVHRQYRGRQHHQKGENRQRHIVAIAPQRKHAHHHGEQNQVNRRRQKSAREKEVIGSVEDEICDRQRRGPALRKLRRDAAPPVRSPAGPGPTPPTRWSEHRALRCSPKLQIPLKQANREKARSTC